MAQRLTAAPVMTPPWLKRCADGFGVVTVPDGSGDG